GTQGARNLVAGNWIGTDVTGTQALGNNQAPIVPGFGFAISLIFETDSTLGGAAAGAGNVISGNPFDAVILEFGAGNTVAGNLIGTDATGAVALGNGQIGLTIQDSSSNTVGGTTTSARNVIAASGLEGLDILQDAGGTSTQNIVAGNLIGTDATGT